MQILEVYTSLLKSQADIDKPKYDRVTQWAQVNNYTFTNIDEASSFVKKGYGSRMDRGFYRDAMEDVELEVPTDGWNVNAEQVIKNINRKKNWSAPGPDRIANFWWKKTTIFHKKIATCFQATAELEGLQFPLWFSEGKTILIPKPGEFRSDAHIASLNNL